jgi:hypothetical protein
VVGTQLANERAPARGAGTAGGIDKGAVRMIEPCALVRDAYLWTSRLKITLDDLLPDLGLQFLDLPSRLASPTRPALKASGACFLRARSHGAGPQRPPGTARKAIFAFSAASILRLLRSDHNWPTGPKLGGHFTKSRRQLTARSASPRPILVRYLFSCTCGSGLALKGVISSSSRQTTRFLNFQPFAVFTNVSS